MKPKAIIFIGFRHKIDSILAAQEAGYLTILLTRKQCPHSEKHFHEIFEENILDPKIIDKLIPKLKKKYKIKGVISNYEHYVVHRSFFAVRFGIPSCSVYSACCTRNKAMQRSALHFMKENIDYQLVKNLNQATEAFNNLGKDVYLKSIAGIKSRLVFPIKSQEEMAKAFEMIQNSFDNLDQDLYDDYRCCDFNFKYPDPKEYFLVEKSEQGQEITVSSLIGNHKIWHAPSICDVYPASVLGKDDTYLAFRILPSKHPQEIVTKAHKATEDASRILGLKNCSVFGQFILRKDGTLKILEIASRMGGYRSKMYQKAYDLDLNALLINAVIGKKIKANQKSKKYVSLLEIFPEKEGTLKSIQNLEKLKNNPDVDNIIQKYQEGDQVGLAKNGFRNILSFNIVADTYQEAYQKSLDYHKLLKVVVD